mgnify:CR=1 FL=1
MLTVKNLRDSFIDFFKQREHKIVPSSSLMPKDDPTLLFTTAGMVQFKPMFAGTVELEYTRAASIQKCLRTSDLENVGRTKRHMTFFEMLGNFSFGDYFKKDAIQFAWDYSTDVIGFNKEDIWVSIYLDDDEAFELWNKNIGIPKHKIVRLGKKDNFWGPAGDTGACGPCSELHIDRGEDYGCGSADCKPGCDCERFMEYWNLVFNQFNQDINGNLNPLPQTGIDTGMGLERLATITQKVDSVYDIDEMQSLIKFISNKSKKEYAESNIIPIRVIAEHARALLFAMSDGIYPSNEGRGYVLRRILRRALRYTRILGLTDPFLYTLIDPLVNIFGEYYPEIIDSSSNVKNVIESEEKRFLETIENGMDRLEEIIKHAKSSNEKTISGKDAFVLYDTFGFPYEMTMEIAEEQNLSVNEQEYESEMQQQRDRGKQSWKGVDTNQEKLFEELAKTCSDTEFLGYEGNNTETTIQAIGFDGEMKEEIKQGDNAIIVTASTSFYAESGGQIGDIGLISSDDNDTFTVTDTKKINKTVVHIGKVTAGSFSKGDTVKTNYNELNKNYIKSNHTATHLLQAALREVLGTHVKQAGSLVEADRFRFDFSHFNAMTDDEIRKVENIINEKIYERIPVETESMELQAAIDKGAMAVFDEKYDDNVRVVSIADYSMELCGGTHVSNTSEIGGFKILKEASPGAGIRRIEAITSKAIMDRFYKQEEILTNLINNTNVTEDALVKKVDDVIKQNKQLEKELQKLKSESLTSDLDSIIKNVVEVNGIKIISNVFNGVDAGELRKLSDTIREKEQNSVVCFGSESNGKALLLFAATKNATAKGIHCGNIIKEAAPVVGGGGGGRPDMAQAGGKNPAALSDAIAKAVEVAKGMLG